MGSMLWKKMLNTKMVSHYKCSTKLEAMVKLSNSFQFCTTIHNTIPVCNDYLKPDDGIFIRKNKLFEI